MMATYQLTCYFTDKAYASLLVGLDWEAAPFAV